MFASLLSHIGLVRKGRDLLTLLYSAFLLFSVQRSALQLWSRERSRTKSAIGGVFALKRYFARGEAV